ncbi:hypothetical protein Tco_0087860 [Tanacetum coccineum]
MVLLKVSSWKGVVRFRNRGKLSPRYIGSFKILARVGSVAYTLELLEELKGIHITFHVSNLKKCLAEGDIVVPMDEIQLDDKLHMIEEPVEIVDREVKRLKKSQIPIIKVRWNSQRDKKKKKKKIHVNVIPPDHDHDVPVVEPNQHDDAPVVPEPVLEDEDEDPKEDEFEEEEDPQEDEDDMEIDIEEDENEPELTYPYEEVDPLNPLPLASESEPDDEIKVENPIEHEDETVPVSVYEVGESSTSAIPREDGDRFLPGFMRWHIDSLFSRMVNFSRRLYGRETAHALVEKKGEPKDKFYGKLILDLGNEVRSSVEQGTAAMEKLVEKLKNIEEKAECKKLKKELEEARLSNTFLLLMPSYCAAERARQVNVRNDASGSGLVRGRDTALAVRECTFARFMKCNPAAFHGVEGAVELRRWFKKTESVFEISECAEGKKVKFAAATLEGLALTWWKTKVATIGLKTVNQIPWTKTKQLMTTEFCPIEEMQTFNELALMCPRMVELERVKVDAYIRGLTDNIKGEVTSSKPADLNEALGTFDVIIGMDWLVKHDAVIVCGEKVVRIPYGNKTLIVEGDKGGSRLKIISCIKARKYVEQGCHLFFAHVTKKKSKEKRIEDVLVIRDFPEVFLEELPGLLSHPAKAET